MNWKQSKFLGTRQFCASHLTAHPIWNVIRCLFSHRGAYIALFIMDLALAEHFLIHFLSRLFKRLANLSLRHESGRVTIFLRSWGLSSPFSLAELSLSSTASSSQLASGDIASLMSPCLISTFSASGHIEDLFNVSMRRRSFCITINHIYAT